MVISKIIENREKQFIFVGGKGGTGKTSSATSIALKCANKGQKTLLISTDPAHSISDSLMVDVSGGDVVSIPDFHPLLFAIEINAKDAGSNLNQLFDNEGTDEIVESLSNFGLDDVNELFKTVPPGLDELIAIAKIIQLIDKKDDNPYEKIIFDTAPTGHTLRLLSLPQFLDNFVFKLMKIKHKIKGMFNVFKLMSPDSKKTKSEFDILEEISKMVIKVRDLFQNNERTEFIVVTIPTVMAISESKDLVEELKSTNILVNNIIVNQVIQKSENCNFCNRRFNSQKSNLKLIKDEFDELSVIEVPYFELEIRGKQPLEKMSQYLK